jgi:hypothetical protein
MPSLDALNILGFIFAAWCFHITRQKLVWVIRGGGIDVFNLKEGESLEPLEFKLPFKVLLSKKICLWYLLNRVVLLLALNFFFWAMRSFL